VGIIIYLIPSIGIRTILVVLVQDLCVHTYIVAMDKLTSPWAACLVRRWHPRSQKHNSQILHLNRALAKHAHSSQLRWRVVGQGPVQMQDLQVGDQVLIGSPDNYKYQPVYAFGHLNKEALGAFYAIATKGGKTPLEMTGEHLVYLAGKLNPVRADSLQVGDVLLSIHGPTEITDIHVVEKQGLFNPLTADGRLVVNEITVFTYIALQENNSEHFEIVFGKGGDYKINLAPHQSFVHLYLTPFRMLCYVTSLMPKASPFTSALA
jgi:hypothetical protein